MEPLQGEAFARLFYTVRESAFHLELQDEYHTPEESEPFRRFLSAEPDDVTWHVPWLSLVRRVTLAGKRINRVRVVTVPHSDYVRWGLSVAPLNIEAGEDIRWLPRHLASGIEFPDDDFWLFDNERLVFTVFEADGRWVGGREVTDPAVVEQCRKAQKQVWELAIPHREYTVTEYASM